MGAPFAWHFSFSLIRFHLSVFGRAYARTHTEPMRCWCFYFFFRIFCSWLVSFGLGLLLFRRFFPFVVVVNVAFVLVLVALMGSSLSIIMISRFQCSSCVMHCYVCFFLFRDFGWPNRGSVAVAVAADDWTILIALNPLPFSLPACQFFASFSLTFWFGMYFWLGTTLWCVFIRSSNTHTFHMKNERPVVSNKYSIENCIYLTLQLWLLLFVGVFVVLLKIRKTKNGKMEAIKQSHMRD